MTPDAERPLCVPCPGCKRLVDRNASECPGCNYQPPAGRAEELLGSLVTVGSILIGFTLASLVQIAASDTRNDDLVQIATGFWIVSSVLFMGVVTAAEALRRRDHDRERFLTTHEDGDVLWGRCESLLTAFAVALLLAALGVIVLGFFFSTIHGVVGVIAAILTFVLLVRVLRV